MRFFPIYSGRLPTPFFGIYVGASAGDPQEKNQRRRFTLDFTTLIFICGGDFLLVARKVQPFLVPRRPWSQIVSVAVENVGIVQYKDAMKSIKNIKPPAVDT